INLSWTSSSNTTTNFIIQRWQTGSHWTTIATVGGSVTSYSDAGLTGGVQYWYQISAYDGIGTSNFSNQVNAIPAPATPTNVAATAVSTGQINVTWADPVNDETGFSLERWSSLNPTYTQIAVINAGTFSYSDTGLNGGTQYWYRLRAFNGSV